MKIAFGDQVLLPLEEGGERFAEIKLRHIPTAAKTHRLELGNDFSGDLCGFCVSVVKMEQKHSPQETEIAGTTEGSANVSVAFFGAASLPNEGRNHAFVHKLTSILVIFSQPMRFTSTNARRPTNGHPLLRTKSSSPAGLISHTQ